MIIESLITVFCGSFTQSPATIQYSSACPQVMNAAAIQTKVEPMIDAEENRVTRKYSDEVTEETGKTVWVVGAFAYTTVYQQRVSISGPIKPFAESASLNLQQGSANLSITWKF